MSQGIAAGVKNGLHPRLAELLVRSVFRLRHAVRIEEQRVVIGQIHFLFLEGYAAHDAQGQIRQHRKRNDLVCE